MGATDDPAPMDVPGLQDLLVRQVHRDRRDVARSVKDQVVLADQPEESDHPGQQAAVAQDPAQVVPSALPVLMVILDQRVPQDQAE